MLTVDYSDGLSKRLVESARQALGRAITDYEKNRRQSGNPEIVPLPADFAPRADTALATYTQALKKAAQADDVIRDIKQGSKAARSQGNDLKMQAAKAKLKALKMAAQAAAAAGDTKRAREIAREAIRTAREGGHAAKEMLDDGVPSLQSLTGGHNFQLNVPLTPQEATAQNDLPAEAEPAADLPETIEPLPGEQTPQQADQKEAANGEPAPTRLIDVVRDHMTEIIAEARQILRIAIHATSQAGEDNRDLVQMDAALRHLAGQFDLAYEAVLKASEIEVPEVQPSAEITISGTMAVVDVEV